LSASSSHLWVVVWLVWTPVGFGVRWEAVQVESKNILKENMKWATQGSMGSKTIRCARARTLRCCLDIVLLGEVSKDKQLG
jgi:hypothetical protein